MWSINTQPGIHQCHARHFCLLFFSLCRSIKLNPSPGQRRRAICHVVDEIHVARGCCSSLVMRRRFLFFSLRSKFVKYGRYVSECPHLHHGNVPPPEAMRAAVGAAARLLGDGLFCLGRRACDKSSPPPLSEEMSGSHAPLHLSATSLLPRGARPSMRGLALRAGPASRARPRMGGRAPCGRALLLFLLHRRSRRCLGRPLTWGNGISHSQTAIIILFALFHFFLLRLVQSLVP